MISEISPFKDFVCIKVCHRLGVGCFEIVLVCPCLYTNRTLKELQTLLCLFFFFRNLSFQIGGAAYLWVRLIHRTLRQLLQFYPLNLMQMWMSGTLYFLFYLPNYLFITYLYHIFKITVWMIQCMRMTFIFHSCPLRKLARWNESNTLIGYPSGQEGTILPAQGYRLCPTSK